MNNNIINLPTLISKIASEGGVDPVVSRRFIHELFVLIESVIATGEEVEIDGLGKFTRGDGPEQPVLFHPDSALAEIVNEPFSAFHPVEINYGAEEVIAPKKKPVPEVAKVTEVIEPSAPDPVVEQPKPIEETRPQPVAQPVITHVASPEPSVIEGGKTIPYVTTISDHQGHEKISEMAVSPIKNDAPVTADVPLVVVNNRSSHAIRVILGIMIGLILGLVGGYFAGKTMGRLEIPFNEDEYETEEPELVESVTEDPIVDEVAIPEEPTESESVEPAVAEPEVKKIEPVYDAVTSSLAKLAGKHYGVKNYWVFIYQANPQLGNPNQIAPGTKVVIPPYESFAGATSEETNAKAKELMNEISKKYRI